MNQVTDPTEITTRFREAWNTHDMDASGRLFHPNATFVNRFGSYWRGVDEIAAGHAGTQVLIYRDAPLNNDAPVPPVVAASPLYNSNRER